MIYGKYQASRDAAWRCLIDFKISSLPINVAKLSAAAGIKVVANSATSYLKTGEFGLSILRDDQWIIVYDDFMPRQRSRFTVAHELGHIFLGHQLNANKYYRSFALDKPDEEIEADVFASRLLAPACVLWGLEVFSAAQIAEICDISNQSAQIRYERFETLKKRNKFLSSPLERQVYQNFYNFIQRNKK